MRVSNPLFSASILKKTSLFDFHAKHGAKFVEFAGWSMPVQYSDASLIASHIHTRNHASVFDVSHMMQLRIDGRDSERFIEKLTVVDLQALKLGSSSLSVFTNEAGGIIDDTMITRKNDHFYVVSNAGCADKVWGHLMKQKESFSGLVNIKKLTDSSLIALQGPSAGAILEKFLKTDLSKFYFMNSMNLTFLGCDVQIGRCGYTGEDGFEISLPSTIAEKFADELMSSSSEVKLAGLGARDSLRLEAGLCLYGNDIDESTTPIEASLAWTISPRRRREGGFLGSSVIIPQLTSGVVKKRVGLSLLTPNGPPARSKAKLLSEDKDIGVITSGCPSPSLKKNIAMGYVQSGYHKIGTKVKVLIRDKLQDAEVVKMPFVRNTYYRESK